MNKVYENNGRPNGKTSKKEINMNTYTIFWLTGKTQIVKGNEPNEAMNNAGIGAGALRVMDFYANGDERKNYIWNKKERTWNKIKFEKEDEKMKTFTEEELKIKSLKDLVAIHNSVVVHFGGDVVKKFTDKKAGVKRVIKVQDYLKEYNDETKWNLAAEQGSTEDSLEDSLGDSLEDSLGDSLEDGLEDIKDENVGLIHTGEPTENIEKPVEKSDKKSSRVKYDLNQNLVIVKNDYVPNVGSINEFIISNIGVGTAEELIKLIISDYKRSKSLNGTTMGFARSSIVWLIKQEIIDFEI